MKQPAVLDFAADGGAVIRIADVGEVPFLDMFGFSPISKVESDIEHADTSERKRFLKKYLRVYKEMYDMNSNGLNEEEQQILQDVDNHLSQKSSAIDVLHWNEERMDEEYVNEIEMKFADDEKKQYFGETHEFQSLCVKFFNLKHSTAWYLMGHINVGIDAARNRIEMSRGWLQFIDHLEEVNSILHNQDYSSYEEQLIDLENTIGLTRKQVEYCMSRKPKDIVQCDVRKVKQEITLKEKEIEFLERLI